MRFNIDLAMWPLISIWLELSRPSTKSIRQQSIIAECWSCSQVHRRAQRLGPCIDELGRSGEAIISLKQAIRLRPEMAAAHNNLGLAFADLASFKDAEAAFEQALRLDPRSIEAHTNLGIIYGQQGRFREAIASYQLALWLQPDFSLHALEPIAVMADPR